MNLRGKLYLIAIAFVVVVTAFGFASFLIFNLLDENIGSLRGAIEAHILLERVERLVDDYMGTARQWVTTGNPKYRKIHNEQHNLILNTLDELASLEQGKQFFEDVKKDFTELAQSAKLVLKMDVAEDHRGAILALRALEAKENGFRTRTNILLKSSLREIHASIERGDSIKKNIALYHVFSVIGASLLFIFLTYFMQRFISVPFRDILTATEKIIGGNMKYRIASDRRDEFGVIGQRFDAMVDQLQQTNQKYEDLYFSTSNQLQKLTVLYDVAKHITSTLDLDEILNDMAEYATKILNTRGCIIRLLDAEKLVVKASYGLPKEYEQMMTLKVGESIAGKVARDGKAFLAADISLLSPELQIPYLDAKSVMTVPLKVSEKVIGTFALYDKMNNRGGIISFSNEDLGTAEGFASMSAIAIEKAQMFEKRVAREKEAVEARKRIEVLFDSVQGGIITVSNNYQVLSANRFVETWIGTPINEIVGKSCLDIFHDKKGICPHCVAQVTFETGDINSITQVSGLNYAELTSYPIRGESGLVSECVVFVQDITDRILYQEEMLSLYREVTQTKEYLESLIDNSADAIVTSDLQGIIKSWNQGAEKIYGFTADEATGKYLPFVPEYLIEAEKQLSERCKNGEVIKNLETVRRRRNGSIIEVSLTLSPIKDGLGAVIGISGISRDISEKKRVENQLVRKNQELSRLFFISSAMRSTLELKRLLRMILTAVTMGDGLGFNRSVLFLVDQEKKVLRGTMGVGPSTQEEAARIWGRLAIEKKTLTEVMQDIESQPSETDSFLDRLSAGIEIPLDSDSIFARAVKERKPLNITDTRYGSVADTVLIQQFGTEAYAIVPLISQDKVIGVFWVDNLFNKRPITDDDMQFLTAFANHVAAAIESAKLFDKIMIAEAELENIFRSISDMVYFTDVNYNIRRVNKAVRDRFSLSDEEIVGRKCYEVFHGMHEPWSKCPHHKTVETKKAYIEEIEDRHTGGTFLASTSPIFDLSGGFLGTVHIVRDVSELKLIREKLATTQRMAALGEVAAKVAHEIRNPLVSVGGFAQRLEKKLDGTMKEYATIIMNEVMRLEAILRDILGFVKEVRLSTKQMNMNDLIRGALLLMTAQIEEKRVAVETYYEETYQVRVDPDRVREAILNILTNAIQATEAGGKIIVRTKNEGDTVLTEITDTGVGIADRDIPFIFDPFYTTKTSGTGLGLAVTRRIIEEHAGMIEVKSRIGEGTTIMIILPMAKEET